MEDNEITTRVWRDGFNEKTKELCQKCGRTLSGFAIAKGWKFCRECNAEWMEKYQNGTDKFSRMIRSDYYDTINGLKSMVGHSWKGKPHKQSWGMHIVNPCKDRNDKYYANKAKLGSNP